MVSLSSLIYSDINRFNSDFQSKGLLKKFFVGLLYFTINKGFRAIFFYRTTHHFLKKNKLHSYYFIQFFNLILNNIEISPKAEIGEGLLIMHPQCIVIGGGKIGKNLSVAHGVTIGLKKKKGEYPIIGDNVQLGAGSKVLGNIEIGSNSIVGSNSVVFTDVPKNSIAVGIPAKIKEIKK